MNSLLVKNPGLLTTVQDLGRQGFGPIGVSASGAADRIAICLGNRLVGNPENAAALEMTLLGGEFEFAQEAVVVATGSDFNATLDGFSIAMNESLQVKAGESIKFGPTRSGARCYLCMSGGICVPRVLGSRSTHLLSGLGGFEGRALRKGDVLPVGPFGGKFVHRLIAERFLTRLALRKTLRVTQGPQSDLFPKTTIDAFFSQSYLVTEETNRMGIRLRGKAAPVLGKGEMISEGVSLGAIQVPAGGQPIILFVEQQTTGGYPILANVISADFSSLGQLRPRDEIRFELVTMAEARKLLVEQERVLLSAELIHE